MPAIPALWHIAFTSTNKLFAFKITSATVSKTKRPSLVSTSVPFGIIKSKVSAVQKENEQLKVSIENSLNLSSIEKAAQDKLGMQKLDNSNKIYLDLQKKDYVEPASEEVILNDNSSWFEKLIKKLTQIIK